MSKLGRELFFSSDFQGRKVFISFEIPEMQWVFFFFFEPITSNVFIKERLASETHEIGKKNFV